MSDEIKRQMRELFPGREVEFETAKGPMKARVYPVGFPHIAAFGDKIAATVDGLVKALAGTDDGASKLLQGMGLSADGALMAAAAPRAVPIVIRELSELVEQCTEWPIEGMTLQHVPHDVAARVVAAWLAESFDQKKSAGWEELARGLGGLVPGRALASAGG